MFDIDVWQEIFSTIRKNKLRSFLTGFAVAWGIFMLMVLLGSGNGLANGVMSNFQDDAQNSMWIWTRKTTLPYSGLASGRRFQFDLADYEEIRNMKGVRYISGRYNVGSRTCSYGKEYGTFNINSCHPDYLYIEKYDIDAGRFVNDIDIRQHRKVIIIGDDVKKALFPKEKAVGKYIKVGATPFRIVGVYSEENSEARQCYIPISTAQALLNSNGKMHRITLATHDMSEADNMALEHKIHRILASNHRVHPNDESAIGIYNSLEDYAQTMSIFNAINIFIWFIGIGTLIAGVVGVGNIMLISVKERTKEFGIRKAIGASPSSIVGLVLKEAIFITSLAGYIGMVLGIGLMELVNILMLKNAADGGSVTLFLNPTVDLRIAISAMLLLVIVGSFAGYIPAKRAASIRPIEALHND